MARFIRLSEEQRDDLVAYLDGELDEAATQQIEQVLASSEVARHEIDMLSRSWDLLNELPVFRASADFTDKTVQQLVASEQRTPLVSGDTVYRQVVRGLVLALWLAVLGACGYAGYLTTNRWIPNDADELLDDYEIVNQLDLYRDAVAPPDADPARRPTGFLEVLKTQRTLTEYDSHAAK